MKLAFGLGFGGLEDWWFSGLNMVPFLYCSF